MTLAELIQAVLLSQECSLYGALPQFGALLYMPDGKPIVGVTVRMSAEVGGYKHLQIFLSDKED